MSTTKTSQGKDKKLAMDDATKDKLILALIENNFSITRACNAVGVDRSAYYWALKWDEDFVKKLTWGENFIGNIVTNGLLEGVLATDLHLRHKYIQLIVQAGLLERFMITSKTKNTEIDSDDIILE
jgi:hypothetical protein